MPNDRHTRRRRLRLPDYDYSHAGAYFITVCTQDRVMLFGEVIDCDVQLNEMGMDRAADMGRPADALRWH